jgi:DNA polymerase III subunit delta'
MPRTTLGRHLIGNGPAAALLERAIDFGRLSHAYLFVGPPSVGKTTLARAFAQALNCTGEALGLDERPCGVCRACRLTADGAYPDFRLIQVGRAEAESGHTFPREGGDKASRVIRIDQVRALQHDADLSAYEGRHKVYVLDAQALNLDAANCLLKTLEEPPPQVVIVLTAADAESLLPTIVSRCQLVRLPAVPTSDLAEGLVGRFGLDVERAQVLAHLSGGRPGFAVGAIEEPKVLEVRTSRISDLVALGRRSRVERFAYAEKLAQEASKDPERVAWTLGLWLGWWRDVMLARLGCEEMIGNYDFLDELKRRARTLSLGQIHAALAGVEQASEQLAQNVNARLALEVLLLDLPAG